MPIRLSINSTFLSLFCRLAEDDVYESEYDEDDVYYDEEYNPLTDHHHGIVEFNDKSEYPDGIAPEEEEEEEVVERESTLKTSYLWAKEQLTTIMPTLKAIFENDHDDYEIDEDD